MLCECYTGIAYNHWANNPRHHSLILYLEAMLLKLKIWCELLCNIFYVYSQDHDGENICCGSVQATVGACNVNGTLTQYCSSSQVPIGSSCPF